LQHSFRASCQSKLLPLTLVGGWLMTVWLKDEIVATLVTFTKIACYAWAKLLMQCIGSPHFPQCVPQLLDKTLAQRLYPTHRLDQLSSWTRVSFRFPNLAADQHPSQATVGPNAEQRGSQNFRRHLCEKERAHCSCNAIQQPEPHQWQVIVHFGAVLGVVS